MGSTFRIRPLHLGNCRMGEYHLLGEGYSEDTRLGFTLYSFLIEGDELALVDLGPMTLEYANAMFRRFDLFREEGDGRLHPDDIVQPQGNIFANLERLGIAPSEIKHIVLTHLHADHHGIDSARNPGAAALFPDALVHASRRGWELILEGRDDGRWEGYIDHAFADYLLAASETGGVVFEDDAEILPGLRTHYLGGHASCSQAVEVRTDWGPAFITSDDVYAYDLLARAVFARLCVTPEDLVRSTNKLIDLATESDGILLPVHDPLLWDFYEEAGERWLELAKAASDRAIEGFRSSEPTFAGYGP